MATYKVLQDIEAEDKFLGPLTLKQFIFAAIAVVSLYLSFFFLTHHVGFLAVMLIPLEIVTGFLAFPWGRDQPTEVWLLAKLRFFFKPRKRIWNQTGIQELVKITVPKHVEQQLTNNLSQTEVKSRLRALADTIDSRGWAIKNVNVNLYTQPAYATQGLQDSDRLISLSSLPQVVPAVDVGEADDIFSSPLASKVDNQLAQSDQQHHSQAVQQMHQAASATTKPADDFWFMSQPATPVKDGFATFGAQAVTVAPGTDLPKELRRPDPLDQADQGLLEKIHKDKSHPSENFRHRRKIQPYDEQAQNQPSNQAPAMTAPPDPAILNLAINNDRNVASLAREAHQNDLQKAASSDDEVVISLH